MAENFEQVCWGQIEVGADLPQLCTEISYKRVILNAAATWDFFPVHHDLDYCRAQGLPTIYVNTMFLQGILDRVITDWAGPKTYIAERQMRMKRLIFAGSLVKSRARVSEVWKEQDLGFATVEIALDVEDARDVCTATTSFWVPHGDEQYCEMQAEISNVLRERAKEQRAKK